MTRATRNSVLLHLTAIVVGLLIIAPFAYMIVASVSPQRDLISQPPHWIPNHLDLTRYEEILGGDSGAASTFRAAAMNSTIVAVSTVAIAITVAIFGAYAFARLEFRFRRLTLMLFLSTYMLPQIALLIPLYLILNNLSLLDSRLGLIIVDSSLVIPFTLWILSNYFTTIPRDLEDAARIDGCSRIGALFRVILPTARPGIFAAVMFAFLLAWDEFMYSLIFTSSNASKTLPVAISEFAGRYTTDFGLVAAGGVLTALPPVLVAVIFQRYVVSGLAAGAVKG
ncbi:MAG: carbohydrate ABC transporter permease [Nocardioidaceae bacterium]